MDFQPPLGQGANEAYIVHLLSQICNESTDPEIIQLLAASATIEIHPIFARERWFGVSDTEILRISPAVVLASRLLTSPQALHFWYAFIFGPRTTVVDLEGNERHCFHRVFQDQSQPLPPEEEQRVLQNLQDLAATIQMITLEDLRETCWGSCPAIEDAPASRVLSALQPTHPGRCTQIRINKRRCDALDPTSKALPQLRRQWLLLAVTLVHEVSHAISTAGLGSGTEQFYEATPTIEMGQGIEQQLFGGLLNGTENFVTVIHLCSPEVLEAYEKIKPLPQQSASPTDAMIKTVAKDEWIATLFTKPFWEKDVVASNGMAVRPPYFPCVCARCLGCIDETASVLTARQEQLLEYVNALPPEAVLGVETKDILRRLRRELNAEMTGCDGMGWE